MYPVSAAYKTAIGQNVRDVKIAGTITLKDDTIINITDEDIVQGSLYVTEQCVAGEDIEVGNVYASEMGLSLRTPLEDPYSLDGARVLINFGIDVGGGVFEYVPLGYFYVTEIQRKANNVNLTALDGMLLFDIPVGDPGSSSPRNFVVYACEQAGVPLGTSVFEIDTFANATLLFAAPDTSKIKTCRDLLMWACQIMGAFARMNRSGELEIVPIKARPSVKTINKAERFNSDVSDFAIQITKVSMQVGEAEYSRGTDGMTMVLEENPLMTGLSESQINTVLDNLLAQITTAVYVPFNSNFIGDPALQPGDYVTLSDTSALGSSDIASIITHSTWRYRGPHNLKGAGKHGLVRGVQNQQMKAVSSIVAIARAAQDLALAANQSTQLIKDAIGGHVLIRQNPDETNEILIMDNPDPDQAVKIWRWNMGGLGYSDNCVGADNPDREYEIAMTMDGAINANFIKTGQLDAGVVRIGPETTFAPGYDPVDNHVYFQYSADGATNWHDIFNPATDKYMRQKVGDSGTWSAPMRVVGEDGYTPIKGVDYFDGVDGQDGTSAYLWVRYSQNANGDPMTTDPTGAVYIGIATTTTPTAPTSHTAYQWSLIKGQDGIPGEKGADGKTSYLHIKYSDDGVTFTANNGETPGAYIGTYVDFNPVDSTDFNAYTWNKVKGEDGQDVRKFTSQPVPPYDVGDLWIGGSDGQNTLICTTARSSGSFVASDWQRMTEPVANMGVDSDCTGLWHFDGTLNSHKGVSATFTRASVAYLEDGTQVASGQPRFEDGKFGKGVLIEEGTTNIAHDPNTDNAWWNAAPTSGIVWGLSNDWSATEQALKVRSYSSSHNGHSFYLDIQRDVWFTLRAKIKNVKNALFGAFLLALYNSAGTCIMTNYIPEILAQYNWTGHNTPDYTEAWITYRIPSGVYTDAVKYTVQLTGHGTSESEIYLKEIQLEQKPYKTTWHPYNSTRSPEPLTIPTAGVLNPQEGTVECWLKTPSNMTATSRVIFDTRVSSNNNALVGYWGTDGKLRMIVGTGTSYYIITGVTTLQPNTWYYVAFRWSATGAAILLNGNVEASSSTAPSLSFGASFRIGSNHVGGEFIDSLIDELRIDKIARTDEEIAGWYKANAPFYTSEDMKQWPGYMKLETDGLKVYDPSEALRVLLGSWIDGAIRKYGLKVIGGEIYSAYISTKDPSASTQAYTEINPNGTIKVYDIAERPGLELSGFTGQGLVTWYYGGIRYADAFINAGTPKDLVLWTTQNNSGIKLLTWNDTSLSVGSGGYDNIILDTDYTSIEGTLNVYGAAVVDSLLAFNGKNCVEFTENYGPRLLYARESPDNKYLTEGVDETSNGSCRIELDPIFLECIEQDDWVIHLTPYSQANIWVDEIGQDFFIVKATADTRFAWTLSAYRKNCKDIYLPEFTQGGDI